MRPEIGWLALGAALGSKQLLARLLAEVAPAAFAPDLQRQLFAALGRGRESVAVLLGALGVPVAADQTAADAVIDKARDHGEREGQRALAHRLHAASRLMTPGEFREYLKKQVREYAGPPDGATVTDPGNRYSLPGSEAAEPGENAGAEAPANPGARRGAGAQGKTTRTEDTAPQCHAREATTSDL